MTSWLEAGAQPQGPTEHMLGKSPVAAQQSWVATVPPALVHASAGAAASARGRGGRGAASRAAAACAAGAEDGHLGHGGEHANRPTIELAHKTEWAGCLDTTYGGLNMLADMHWAVELSTALASTLATANPRVKVHDTFAGKHLR